MDGLSISKVAERTGFPPTTLRFYEQAGLVRPQRTDAGYRCYNERDIEVLSFIGRAKGFGLSLEEITELLALLDDDHCAPVQGRLRSLIDAKIADARTRILELERFATELERVASGLEAHTPDGPCDDACGCTTDSTVVIADSAVRTKPPRAVTR
jgi:DNA-binding transcriptional MerR regulator